MKAVLEDHRSTAANSTTTTQKHTGFVMEEPLVVEMMQEI